MVMWFFDAYNMCKEVNFCGLITKESRESGGDLITRDNREINGG